MPAFQIAASIVLLIISLDMLRVQRSRVQETHEEKQAGTEESDIAITPLAIPMLAGPGAITTTAPLPQNEADTISKHIALYLCILAVAAASYLIFRLAVRGPAPAQPCHSHPFPQNRENSRCIYPTAYHNEAVQAAYSQWKNDTVTSDGRRRLPQGAATVRPRPQSELPYLRNLPLHPS